jgi:Kdo2-lipid IVA lauroyltransferase/acyltransferase
MARFILGHRLRALGERHGSIEAVLYRLDRAFFGALLWLIRRLPVDAASRLGARIGSALGPRFRKGRALEDNLRLAFPDKSDEERRRIARAAWGNAGAVFAEYGHLDEIAFGEDGGRIQVELLADIRTLRDATHPAVFVTAHQANWEVSAAAIARQGVPLAVVYSPPTNPLLDELLNRWRTRLGCELLARDESMRPLLHALRQGTSVGIVMDRRVDSGTDVALFGHPKPTTLIPARLALRYGFDLVPIRIERLQGARFRATFYPPVAVPEGDDEIARAVCMTERVHALFEQWIRERPGDWFCSKRLWPKSAYSVRRGRAQQAAATTPTANPSPPRELTDG